MAKCKHGGLFESPIMAGLRLDKVNRKKMDGNIFNDLNVTVKLKKGMEIWKSKKNALRNTKKEKRNPNLLLVSAVLWFCIICTCFIACLNM